MELERSRRESGDVNSILISWQLDLSRALVKEQSEIGMGELAIFSPGRVRAELFSPYSF